MNIFGVLYQLKESSSKISDVKKFRALSILFLILIFAFAQPLVVLVLPAHATSSASSAGNQNYPRFVLTFTESGLPNATVWYVTLNGTITNLLNSTLGSSTIGNSNFTNITPPAINQTLPNLSSYFSKLSSTSGSISFTIPEGTYNYTIGSVPGYSVNPSSGSITLDRNVTVNVKFTNLNMSNLDKFNVTFIESGLPIGLSQISPKITWSVSLNNITLTTNGSTLTFLNVKAGNYSWVAHIVNVTGAYYTPHPLSGKIFVPIQSHVIINYTGYAEVNIEPDNSLFGNVKPSGTHWYRIGSTVNLTAVPSYECTFFDWAGTMEDFGNISSPNTTMIVEGPSNVTAEFATAVIIRETGIPQVAHASYFWGIKVTPLSPLAQAAYYGSEWFFGLNESGMFMWGTSSSPSSTPIWATNSSDIILYLTNGTYKITAIPGYIPTGPSTIIYSPTVINRTITVNAQMLTFDIGYVEGVPVNFTETGLPKGTPWAVEINGTYYSFIAGYSSPPVYLPRYISMTFSVQPITGYSISPEAGVMSFNGPSNFTVSFSSVKPTGMIYSQYSGYFYSGLPVLNVFGFNGSWGSAVPVSVSSNIGPFNPPNGLVRYWTSPQVNMGNFNSDLLVVRATYPNGETINYTYHISVIHSPSWLIAFANSPYVSMSVSPPEREWGNNYTLTFNTGLSTGTLLAVNANLNIISGDYAFLPSVPLTLTLTSSGNMSLSTSINPNSVNIKLDSVTLTVGGSVSLSGSFEFSQNTIVWKSASVDLAFNTQASTNVLITGIEVPGTDYTIGIWLKIAAGPDFSILVHLQPTTNGNYEITNGLPLMVSGVTGGVGVTITLSVNGGLSNIVSAGGGGGLKFMQYIGVPPEPLDMGGNITGTVFISATAFGISWTIWQDSGLLYSWGASSDPAVNQVGNVTYVKAYFNLTGYNSLVWESGEWNGTLLHDVYPYTTFSTAPGIGGDYLFYTYYNTSNPVHPLTVKGIFMSYGRNSTPVVMPNFGNFETTGPEAFVLPNGSVELLYAALPESQIKNSSSLFSVNTVLLQASLFNGRSWSAPVNITSSDVANSYTYRDGYALVIETPSMFSPLSSVQEYSVPTGRLISSIPLANASYFEYFNPELSTAVVRFSNMSYAILNLNRGTVKRILTPINATLLQVGSATNSSDMIYYLLSANGRDAFELYNVTSSKIIYTQNVSENAYPSYFVYGSPYSALITGQEPAGISIYAVNLSSNASKLYRTLYAPNMTFYGVSEGSGNLYIYFMNSYGQAYQPLYNLSAAVIPFNAPPAPLLSLQYNGSGIIASWSAPYAQQYNLNSVYLTVNGSMISSGAASGKVFYPVKSPGNYIFTAYSGNAIGNSSTSRLMGIYPVTFKESGLQANSSWSISVQGISELGQKLQFNAQTSSSYILTLIPDGKYTYSITVPSGYTVSQVNGSFQVNRSALTITNSFSKSSASYTASNSSISKSSASYTASNSSSYWEIAAVIAFAVIVAIFLTRKKFSK